MAGLTRREIEVAMLIRQGNSDQKIANIMFISANTVRRHKDNIYAKLGYTHKTNPCVRESTWTVQQEKEWRNET